MNDADVSGALDGRLLGLISGCYGGWPEGGCDQGAPPRRGDIAIVGEYLPALCWTCGARQWRERHARGDVIVVRYADDSVVGFRTKVQAQQFVVQLHEWLARSGLSLTSRRLG